MKENKALYSLAGTTESGNAVIVQRDLFMKGVDYLLGVIDADAKNQQALIDNADDLTSAEKMDLMMQVQLRRTVLGITVIAVPYVLYKALA